MTLRWYVVAAVGPVLCREVKAVGNRAARDAVITGSCALSSLALAAV